jgi:hypothetical protein
LSLIYSQQALVFAALSEDEGTINLYYLDETGFSLIPSVPYGWQDIGEYLPIPSRRSRSLNVLGIMGRSNHLETIEILWRFIKYEWLEIDAYSSEESLVASVEKILEEFGENYVINFV